MDLSGKTCLVFGAGRGIGKRVAELFSNTGANLVISSRTENELHELEYQLNAGGNPNVISVAGDREIRGGGLFDPFGWGWHLKALCRYHLRRT